MKAAGKCLPCRLCRAPAELAFRKEVLARYDVRYYRCTGCGSVQTEKPYWLDEAYAIPGLHIDVGAPTRSIKNWLASVALLERLDLKEAKKCVDFGAGPGLYARLMRSSGFDFTVHDRYADPIFATYFKTARLAASKPGVLTAFEVFEHLPEPRKTLDALLSLRAPVILFTTWLNDGQPEDWIYYLPDCGQHVFFYSDRGLREFASAHGYRMQVCQYFYVLTLDASLTAAQISACDDFCLNSIALVEGGIRDTVTSVIMGNAAIDSDFAASEKLFREERRRRKGAKRPKRR